MDTENVRNCFEERFGTQEHGYKASLFKNYLGEDVLGVHAHIPEMNWCLLAEMGEEEALAPVATLTRIMLSILAVISVVGILFSVLISRTITKPIMKLHQGTEEIMKGNLDYNVGTGARDEIGQLSRTFNSMTANLKKTREELEEYSSGLEEKVKERTEELDKANESLKADIVERKVLIEKLSEANVTLEERGKALEEVSGATLNIAYDLDAALIETAKAKDGLDVMTRKLERSNKDLQDFVYIVSHDLKAPVRKVTAFGDLLKESLEGRLDEDEQENFEFMIEGATRMQQLIDDLLLYSRVTTKVKPMTRVDLNEVIEDFRNVELATQLEDTGGVIEVPESLPAVHADASQMHQLLQNLIGNGLKYHREGVPPVITVRGKRVGNMDRIEVQDNGIGILEEHYEKIFKMFQRLHPGDEYEGTGVGLAVCKRIVERHGGEIGVKSTPGEGSVFWFTLPGEGRGERA